MDCGTDKATNKEAKNIFTFASLCRGVLIVHIRCNGERSLSICKGCSKWVEKNRVLGIKER